MSLLDYRPRAATVVAATPARAIEIPHEALLDLWGRDKDLQIVLLTNMARILSRRLRRMNE
jgi:CRP-like cAMP-binding protein